MGIELNVPSSIEIEAYNKSPRFFGAENELPKETLIVDEPLEITASEYKQLQHIAERVVGFIDSYNIKENGENIGADPKILERCIDIDHNGNSTMRYGGLDLYQDPTSGFKVLEINPRAQAMGLQDFRQEILGIDGQPKILEHFLEWMKNKGYRRILALGSRSNPFWRSYQRVVDKINEAGGEAFFGDSVLYLGKYQSGFIPHLILKFCSNRIFLTENNSTQLVNTISENKIPIVNSLASMYYGYRGFMKELEKEESELLPKQKVFTAGITTSKELEAFPWVKLEAEGKAYVANYRDFRRWGKDVITSLINHDLPSAQKILEEKDGGDARRLKEVIGFIKDLPLEQIVWVGQSNIEPRSVRLKIKGNETDLKILHRLYWFKKEGGKIVISLEGFGCTHEQFQRSKGKINAGTGVAVPVVIK